MKRSLFVVLAVAVIGIAVIASGVDAKTKKVKAAAGEGDDTVTHKVCASFPSLSA
jgi:hypothetical protein